MIFAACTAAGFSASSLYSRRVRQLEAFAELISYVGSQIEGFLTPLDRIYASFQSRTLDECGFLATLRQGGGGEAMEACSRTLNLTANERNELVRFFDGLGAHGVHEASRHCAYFEKRIGELAVAAREEYRQRGRVCRTLGMLLGLMLAIILL